MPVYLESENIITSLGFSVEENLKAMGEGISGIRMCNNTCTYPISPFRFRWSTKTGLMLHFRG